MPVTQNKHISPQSIKTGRCVVTGAYAQPITDTPANTQQLMEAGANGAKVVNVGAIARATVTASQLALFVSKAADAHATKTLLPRSKLMAAYTMATTTENTSAVDFGYNETTNPLYLEAGDRLHLGSAVALAGGISGFAQYQDY